MTKTKALLWAWTMTATIMMVFSSCQIGNLNEKLKEKENELKACIEMPAPVCPEDTSLASQVRWLTNAVAHNMPYWGLYDSSGVRQSPGYNLSP